jgi:hypothetical protein
VALFKGSQIISDSPIQLFDKIVLHLAVILSICQSLIHPVCQIVAIWAIVLIHLKALFKML